MPPCVSAESRLAAARWIPRTSRGVQADEDRFDGRRRSRRTTNVANTLMAMLVTTGVHHGGRPARPRLIASVSMKMPRHVGQGHAPERRPIGCMTDPSVGHCNAFVV